MICTCQDFQQCAIVILETGWYGELEERRIFSLCGSELFKNILIYSMCLLHCISWSLLFSAPLHASSAPAPPQIKQDSRKNIKFKKLKEGKLKINNIVMEAAMQPKKSCHVPLLVHTSLLASVDCRPLVSTTQLILVKEDFSSCLVLQLLLK